MADERQATITFTGLPKVIGGTITFSRGITPSTIAIDTVPQANLTQPVGDVTVEWGIRHPGGALDNTDPQAESFTLIDCAVDFSSIDISGSQVWSLQLLDRRWRWQRGEISGRYNQRFPDGSFATATQKTPQELAELCLDAMGEVDYDVSQMPNTQYITVDWDVSNPAQCLLQVCEEVKCEITISLAAGNPVVIHRRGVGQELPATKVRSFSTGANMSQAPELLRAVCGPTVFQRRLVLEAVGVDTEANDNEILPIASLSYAPAAGFQSPLYMSDVTASVEAHKLASETVYRYFRPLEFSDGSLNLPSVSPGFTDSAGAAITAITSIRQLQLTTGMIASRHVDNDYVPLPPKMYGTWFSYGIKGGAVTEAQYRGAFTVDAARGLVITQEPLFKIDGSNAFIEPVMFLEVAFTVRDATQVPLRHRREEAFAGTSYGGQTHIIRADAKFRTVQMVYSDIDTESSAIDNITALNAELDELIDYELDLFEDANAQDAVYGGIRPQELDGTIRQVVWTIGYGRAAETRIGYNKDADQYGLSEEAKKQRHAENQASKAITGFIDAYGLLRDFGRSLLRSGEGTS